MMMDVLKLFREKKWECILLFVIIAIGFFLRTYHFHDWLHFGSDQARDIILVEGVVDKGNEWPLLGADASNTHFKLGPAYYYFQIISMKIFGDDIAVVAYPDVLFSLLAIPLFYFFLRRYFKKHLSLALTGLYAVSFFGVEYSRFAWNTNPIPFFTLLYLYSMLKFLETRERTRYLWIVLLGISIGVGIQLHTLLLLLLPAVSFVLFLFLLKKNWRVLGRIALVMIIVLLCNFGQIKHEIATNGTNANLFLTAFTDRSQSGTNRFLTNLKMDILSHAQANMHILTSLGDRGNFTFSSLLSHPEKIKGRSAYGLAMSGIVLSVIFSVLGYGLLVFRAWKEDDEKRKYFLRLTLLYATCFFLILFSIARGAPLRYFIHMTFVPFVLLGLLINCLVMRFPKWYIIPTVSLFTLLFVANAYTLTLEARELATGMRGDSGFVVLGEAEEMVDYMISRSAPEKEVHFLGGTQYVSTYYKSLKYLAEKKGLKLNLADRKEIPTSDKPYFFITKSLKDEESFDMDHFEMIEYMNFGRVGLYQLRKQ